MASDDPVLTTARRLSQRRPRDDLPTAERARADETDPSGPVGPDSLNGATDWLNSTPLSSSELRGRVVLVNFWTFTCINWLRQLPYVRSWEQTYRTQGLTVVGVHSPEFGFEQDVESVRRATVARSITFPVAVDNGFTVWRSFHNRYWPAIYLIDPAGRLRHHSFGEGAYAETEAVIRQLLTEAGADDLGPEQVAVESHGIEAPADWTTLRSAETYLGFDRTAGFASSPGLAPEGPQAYAVPTRLRTGHWALSGTWTVHREFATSRDTGGRLTCRFHARDLHLVATPGEPGSPVRVRVTLDGQPPGADHGLDVDARGAGLVSEPRLHQLIRQRGHVGTRAVDITFLDPGVEVYAITFG